MKAQTSVFFAAGRQMQARAAFRSGLRAGRAGRINAKPTSNLFAREFRAGLIAGFRGGLLAARRRQEAA